MNQDQFANAVQKIVTLASGYAIAKGYGDSQLWQVLVPAIIALATFYWSHRQNATPAPASAQGGKIGPTLMLLIALPALSLSIAGCSTSQQAAVYKAESATVTTVDAAMQAWGDYCKQFNPPYAQRLQVKALYEKAQAAETAVLDAERLVSSLTNTNSASAIAGPSAQLASAQQQASQTLSDLVTLLKSFGVKL